MGKRYQTDRKRGIVTFEDGTVLTKDQLLDAAIDLALLTKEQLSKSDQQLVRKAMKKAIQDVTQVLDGSNVYLSEDAIAENMIHHLRGEPSDKLCAAICDVQGSSLAADGAQFNIEEAFIATLRNMYPSQVA